MVVALVAAFGVAAVVPIPRLPDPGRALVVRQLGLRLPGWRLVALDGSWEGAYRAMLACGDVSLEFQYVPNHGLPAGAAHLTPSDDRTRHWLAAISDRRRDLLWAPYRPGRHTLLCGLPLARASGAAEGSGR